MDTQSRNQWAKRRGSPDIQAFKQQPGMSRRRDTSTLQPDYSGFDPERRRNWSIQTPKTKSSETKEILRLDQELLQRARNEQAERRELNEAKRAYLDAKESTERLNRTMEAASFVKEWQDIIDQETAARNASILLQRRKQEARAFSSDSSQPQVQPQYPLHTLYNSDPSLRRHTDPDHTMGRDHTNRPSLQDYAHHPQQTPTQFYYPSDGYYQDPHQTPISNKLYYRRPDSGPSS